MNQPATAAGDPLKLTAFLLTPIEKNIDITFIELIENTHKLLMGR